MPKILIFICLFLLTLNLSAEVTTDGSLGRATTLPGPDFQIDAGLGQQKGSNLFHSFSVFNVNTGESATFTGPSSITNILTRVTGGSRSFIDGKLGSDIANANLYLLNPNGILFGKNASLDLTGSFHASTADVLHLEDGGRFAVTNPSNSLLTVAPPEAFGFLNNDPAKISVQSSSLEVREEKEISLIGGDLLIEGGALYAPSGRINLAAVDSKGKVIPKSDGLAMESFERQGQITVSQFFLGVDVDSDPLPNIDVSGDGGQVFIRAGQFVLDNAWMYADTYGDKNGLIDIVVDGNMQLIDSSEIGASNYGDNQRSVITVTANELQLKGINSGELQWALGQIGQLSQEDLETFYGMNEQDANFLLSSVGELLGDPELSFDKVLSKIGKDKIAKQYRRLFIPVFSKITTNDSSNFPSAKGSDIQISASVFAIDTGIVEAFTTGSGHAGNINVDADTVTLNKLGYINAATGFSRNPALVESGSGQAGNITVNATESISLSDFSSISVATAGNTTGDAGDIYLKTPNLTLNLGTINAFSYGSGNAGSINITTDTALLTGGKESGIYTEAKFAGGGNINLQVHDNLSLVDSRITAEAKGDKPQDKGGNITLESPAVFTLDNSQLLANAYAGNGGRIDISTRQFNILGDSRIDVSSELGFSGEFWLNKLKLRNELLLPPPEIVLIRDLLSNRCAGLTRRDLSRLLIIGRDTLPSAPEDLKTHLFIPE